jgi:hypothetical protein
MNMNYANAKIIYSATSVYLADPGDTFLSMKLNLSQALKKFKFNLLIDYID